MGLLDMFGGLSSPYDDQGSNFIRGLLAQGFNPLAVQPFGQQAAAPMNIAAPKTTPVAAPAAADNEEDTPTPKAQPVQQPGLPPAAIPVAGTPTQPSGNPLQSLGDLIGGIYGKGGPGDGLIALGAGLMSKRRFGEGLQAGLDNMQRQQYLQAQTGQAQQKLAQQQAGLQSRIQAIKAKSPDMPDANAAAVAANDSLFQAWAKQNIPGLQGDNYGVVNGYYFDKSDPGSGAKPIPGMPVKSDAPSSIQEYEYAKKNGYQGSFQDWQTQGGGSKMPATVAEYEYAKKGGYTGTFEDWQKTKAAKFMDTTVSPDLVDSLVAQKARGLPYPPGLARSNPGLIAAAEAKFAQLYGADEGANKIVENKAANIGLAQEHRTLGAQEARAMSAANEAYGALNLLRQASANVPRTNSTWFNNAVQAWQSGAQGDPNLAALGGAIMSFKNAYARAINPNGTPHDSDKVEAAVEGRLKTATGPGALEAVMNQLETEVDMARRSPQAGRKMLLNIREGKNPVEGLDPIFRKQEIAPAQPQSAFGMIGNILGFGGKQQPAQPVQAPSWRIVK